MNLGVNSIAHLPLDKHDQPSSLHTLRGTSYEERSVVTYLIIDNEVTLAVLGMSTYTVSLQHDYTLRFYDMSLYFILLL